MSAFGFIITAALFAATAFCGVCYGVALRDYRQWHELGHADRAPVCIAAIREADLFLVIGAVTYLVGLVALARIFWST